jgi:hypothetical protein
MFSHSFCFFIFYFFLFFMLEKLEKEQKNAHSTVEETSVAGKQTGSRAQGTYLCSMKGNHVQDKDTEGNVSSRDKVLSRKGINRKAGN